MDDISLNWVLFSSRSSPYRDKSHLDKLLPFLNFWQSSLHQEGTSNHFLGCSWRNLIWDIRWEVYRPYLQCTDGFPIYRYRWGRFYFRNLSTFYKFRPIESQKDDAWIFPSRDWHIRALYWDGNWYVQSASLGQLTHWLLHLRFLCIFCRFMRKGWCVYCKSQNILLAIFC